MREGIKHVRKTFLLLVLVALAGGTTKSAQVSGRMELALTRERGQWSVKAKFNPAGQELTNPVHDLKVGDNEIEFFATMLENELRFRGKSKDDSMNGIIEGFTGGSRTATGTWSLTRQRTNSPADAFAGNWVGTFIFLASGQPSTQPRWSDVDFNANVTRAAYPKQHPKVLFDEAHNNSDTSGGSYRPFADMITSDGYSVVPNRESLSKSALNGYKVLVIVNASGPKGHRDAAAFTELECDAVRDWVSSGGALLLITDHAPFSVAAAQLSKRFGVDLTNGYTIDTVHYNKDSDDQTELIFSRDDGLISEHSITRGRNESERINRVLTFTGTSLKGPEKSVAFLKLADTAIDVLPPERKPASPNEQSTDHKPVSAAGRAQGIALEFVKGRVVVLGEAAMLTAQVTPQGLLFGINVSGTDNRQLALSIMHWLSGLLK